jgi:hypothetical protein
VGNKGTGIEGYRKWVAGAWAGGDEAEASTEVSMALPQLYKKHCGRIASVDGSIMGASIILIRRLFGRSDAARAKKHGTFAHRNALPCGFGGATAAKVSSVPIALYLPATSKSFVQSTLEKHVWSMFWKVGDSASDMLVAPWRFMATKRVRRVHEKAYREVVVRLPVA